MAPTHKKRLLLLCGGSLLTLQLAALPIDLGHLRPTLQMAQAQESCFIAGTMILMADGSSRAIETIARGELVMGRRGRVNTVRACERTVLGTRRLYALNGGRPFVTAEHPFLTAEGWKALDPEATRRENAALDVASLQLGDRLCRATVRVLGGERRSVPTGPGVLFMQGTTMLEAVAAFDAAAETPLFNLLLDGDHSYVADGWIVHNKDGNDADGSAAPFALDGSGTSGPSDTGAPAGSTFGDSQKLGATGQPGATPSLPDDGPVADFLSDLGMRQPDEAGLQPRGAPLTPEQEQGLISRGWRPRE